MEGALKLKEISYIHAEGYPAAEMKHGPIALIDENMPVVVVAPKDSLFDKVLSNIREIKARNAKVIVVTTPDCTCIREYADDVIYVPSTLPMLMPIVTCVPLQRSGGEERLLYPDAVKVWLRPGDGQVVGMDATAYWQNHGERSLRPAALAAEDAREKLHDSLTVSGVRRALITKDGEERDCHEFSCTRGEESLRVYLDAATGQEADIRYD